MVKNILLKQKTSAQIVMKIHRMITRIKKKESKKKKNKKIKKEEKK